MFNDTQFQQRCLFSSPNWACFTFGVNQCLWSFLLIRKIDLYSHHHHPGLSIIKNGVHPGDPGTLRLHDFIEDHDHDRRSWLSSWTKSEMQLWLQDSFNIFLTLISVRVVRKVLCMQKNLEGRIFFIQASLLLHFCSSPFQPCESPLRK